MKTSVRTERVEPTEAYTYEVTTYTCDVPGCSFETEDKEAAEEHHGEKHAVKGKAHIGETEFYHFETEEDRKAWAQHHGAERDYLGKWSGPGWYSAEWGSEPCGRGCCSRTTLHMYSASETLEGWRSSISERVQWIRELRKLTNKEKKS